MKAVRDAALESRGKRKSKGYRSMVSGFDVHWGLLVVILLVL